MKIKMEDFWVGLGNHTITSRIKVKKDSPIREEGIEEIKEYLRGLWQAERELRCLKPYLKNVCKLK